MDDKPEVRTFKLDQIRRDGGTQPRALINQTVAADYAQDMKNGDVFDPVDVYYDGTDYWLSDGFHRMAACELAGISTVEANVYPGTRRDAILGAIRGNRNHGLRFTNDDKRRTVGLMLADAEWNRWSDNRIAKECGVSQPFVSDLRKKLTTYNGYNSPTARKGADGRTINTTNIGKKQPVGLQPPAPDDSEERRTLDPDKWYVFDMPNRMVITPGYLSQFACQRAFPDRTRFTIAKGNFFHQHSDFRAITVADWQVEMTERISLRNDPLIADMINMSDLPGNTTVEVLPGEVKRNTTLVCDDVMQVVIDGGWTTYDQARAAFPDGRRFSLVATPGLHKASWPILTPEQWDECEQARDAQREEDDPTVSLTNEEAEGALDEILGRPDGDDPVEETDAAYYGDPSNAVEAEEPEEEEGGIAIPSAPEWFLKCSGEQSDAVFEYLESLVDEIRDNGFYQLDAKDWHILHTTWLSIFEEE